MIGPRLANADCRVPNADCGTLNRSNRGNEIHFFGLSSRNIRILLLRLLPLTQAELRVVCFFLAILLFSSLSLCAQPVPKITSISPEWIQRGTTVNLTIVGENLGS